MRVMGLKGLIELHALYPKFHGIPDGAFWHLMDHCALALSLHRGHNESSLRLMHVPGGVDDLTFPGTSARGKGHTFVGN